MGTVREKDRLALARLSSIEESKLALKGVVTLFNSEILPTLMESIVANTKADLAASQAHFDTQIEEINSKLSSMNLKLDQLLTLLET